MFPERKANFYKHDRNRQLKGQAISKGFFSRKEIGKTHLCACIPGGFLRSNKLHCRIIIQITFKLHHNQIFQRNAKDVK